VKPYQVANRGTNVGSCSWRCILVKLNYTVSEVTKEEERMEVKSLLGMEFEFERGVGFVDHPIPQLIERAGNWARGAQCSCYNFPQLTDLHRWPLQR
jgi:hypothetical protein